MKLVSTRCDPLCSTRLTWRSKTDVLNPEGSRCVFCTTPVGNTVTDSCAWCRNYWAFDWPGLRGISCPNVTVDDATPPFDHVASTVCYDYVNDFGVGPDASYPPGFYPGAATRFATMPLTFFQGSISPVSCDTNFTPTGGPFDEVGNFANQWSEHLRQIDPTTSLCCQSQFQSYYNDQSTGGSSSSSDPVWGSIVSGAATGSGFPLAVLTYKKHTSAATLSISSANDYGMWWACEGPGIYNGVAVVPTYLQCQFIAVYSCDDFSCSGGIFEKRAVSIFTRYWDGSAMSPGPYGEWPLNECLWCPDLRPNAFPDTLTVRSVDLFGNPVFP